MQTDTVGVHWNKPWTGQFCDNQQPKPKSDRLRSSACDLCNKTVRINSKKLMCMYCKSFVHLQYMNGYVKVVISKNFLSQECVCESCHFKELPFSWMGMWNLSFQRTSFHRNGYVKVVISKNFFSHEWVCESYHFKELPFSRMGM